LPSRQADLIIGSWCGKKFRSERVATPPAEMPGYDPFPQRDLGWLVYSMSRPLIELTVRQRVQRYDNIRLRPRCRVRDLIASADGATATAIRCENADGNSETLPADLVVDATGRGNLAGAGPAPSTTPKQ
jgi:2-polyprenyl-6-methoxyphenol hydroxylase-like FAD-dependent oxidoreductase